MREKYCYFLYLNDFLVLFKRKTNIVDNMVYMLSKYSDDLEGIVQERTEQLCEEQKKTEALLEQMLPR